MNGLIAGVFADSLSNSIRLRTGHVQVRAPSYDDQKLSLSSKDLLASPDQLVSRIAAMPEVTAAAPVLWAGAILGTADQSSNLELVGIDPSAAINDPIKSAIVAGKYLAADDREGVLIGKDLADSLGVSVGQKVQLTVLDADGNADQGPFTIRGLFSTGVPTYDQGSVLMPLSKAQAFTRATGHASSIIIMLHNQDDAAKVAAALKDPDLAALTWQDLNAVVMQAIQFSFAFYMMLDFIVILVVAVMIANTLLMGVFERIREIGILSALGMRRRQVLVLFMLEAVALGLLGIVLGFILGLGVVTYFVKVGYPIGNLGAAAGSFAMGTVMYAHYDIGTFVWLSFWTLVIIILGSLYPAWFAARLEPVDALHHS
jgi:ABC-type lipoprotein release transport system permease subunit